MVKEKLGHARRNPPNLRYPRAEIWVHYRVDEPMAAALGVKGREDFDCASSAAYGTVWPPMSTRGRHEESWSGKLLDPHNSDLTARIRKTWDP